MTKKMKIILGVVVAAGLVAGAISYKNASSASSPDVQEVEEAEKLNPVGPAFNADSALAYCAAQCDFGPRVMNSEAHDKCGEWIVSKFKQFGCEVETQKADLKGYDGTILKNTNIIAHYNPKAETRILLCAHWDSRPWADNDPDKKNWHTPVMGANDGASGVGVLLEIARQLQKQPAEMGIDLVFFDAEDYGTAQFDKSDNEDSWGLGAQYWSRAPHVQGYNARFGILLDMVGGKGGTFYKEYFSKQAAPDVVEKVWGAAQNLGYASTFVAADGGAVTDDHVYVNKLARIPCIDIVNCEPNNQRSSFGSRWHTINDTMEGIDRATLQAVGQTVMQVIYNEQ